ncbi:MAG: hypothetical protein SFU83_02665 [Meiothermus sp.]|nr:hypothetical protein [Meiothermus sp.]
MKNTQGFLARYGWILALAGGAAIYLLYPTSLPFLLFGGMMLMHLGGHGGHGGHTHDRDTQPRPGQEAHQHRPDSSPRQPSKAETYKAGFETKRQTETAQAESRPHRGCH